MAETEEMVLHTSKRLRNLSLEKGKSTKGIITAMASMAPLSQEHADMDIFTGEAIDVVIGSSRDDGKFQKEITACQPGNFITWTKNFSQCFCNQKR
ncbi:uncharacterized protein LOC125942489 isoform X2 [Dermacentor silvarum]|uniref:uncharacterized protein LOC125942489 isoform X2 n=1 Tax=Dermacentor silvarum TaxID=543639 RepID=UPI0021017366|nr:uncharacterized protein LOC125942489 isoform X2 [Dermacentor silvarum]